MVLETNQTQVESNRLMSAGNKTGSSLVYTPQVVRNLVTENCQIHHCGNSLCLLLPVDPVRCVFGWSCVCL